jgi:hypothetical protein
VAAVLAHTPVLTAVTLGVALVVTGLHRAFHRHVHIYGVAFAVISTYVVADRVMDRVLHLSDAAQDRVYGTVHRIMVRATFLLCMSVYQIRYSPVFK